MSESPSSQLIVRPNCQMTNTTSWIFRIVSAQLQLALKNVDWWMNKKALSFLSWYLQSLSQILDWKSSTSSQKREILETLKNQFAQSIQNMNIKDWIIYVISFLNLIFYSPEWYKLISKIDISDIIDLSNPICFLWMMFSNSKYNVNNNSRKKTIQLFLDKLEKDFSLLQKLCLNILSLNIWEEDKKLLLKYILNEIVMQSINSDVVYIDIVEQWEYNEIFDWLEEWTYWWNYFWSRLDDTKYFWIIVDHMCLFEWLSELNTNILEVVKEIDYEIYVELVWNIKLQLERLKKSKYKDKRFRAQTTHKFHSFLLTLVWIIPKEITQKVIDFLWERVVLDSLWNPNTIKLLWFQEKEPKNKVKNKVKKDKKKWTEIDDEWIYDWFSEILEIEISWDFDVWEI